MKSTTETEIENSLSVLQKGGIILYPTDTIWGIGCDATREDSINRICEIKNRPPEKNFLVLVSDASMLEKYVQEIPSIVWELIEQSDEPLTIIYPQGIRLPENLLAPDGSIGIRITKDEFSQMLIRKLKKPLVGTSANKSGRPAPAAFHQIDPEILGAVDYVVNLKKNDHTSGKPSSIIKVGINGEIKIIRH